ncbi:MAG: right-handed parallel beta-helix repeat-containing protein [Lachnospiraceae bacterium]|nr:right-handed parallel beta-helix repeat-containing protein [Lachnospiraceae bacterium]
MEEKEKKKKKGLIGFISAHPVLSSIFGVLLAGGITVGVLFATGVLGGKSGKITDDWLREALAADDTRVIELNNNVKSKGAYEVNGTKTLTGTGKITLNQNAGYVLSINDGASLTMDGIELNVKNIGTNAVIVRAGGSLVWNDGTISYPKQYSIMNYGDTTINGGTFEYAGASWVYIKAGTTVNVTGGNFVKSTTAGFEVERNAYLNISGENTWMERAGTNTINNNGTVVMTGGTISQSEVWTITNHGSLDMKNVTVKDCALKGAVYNYSEATKCEIDSCTFSGSKTYQIYNAGEAVVRNTVMEKSNASTVNNHNVITLENCQILNSNYHGIYNERGTVNIKDMVIDGTVYKAVQNKAGFVTIDGLKTDNIGGTAIGNVAVVAGGDYGWIKAKNLDLSGAVQYNLVSYGGTVEVADSTFNISEGTNIYVRNGEGTFENIKVYGSSTPGKAAVCCGSPAWRTGSVTIGGDDTFITGGSRGISNYGTLTLNGGTITGNKSSGEHLVGAGVYNVGVFTMNGGVIKGNESISYGGGVRNGTSSDEDGTKHYGQMYMYGGEITGNYADANGGGISIGDPRCGLYMYGGTVSGNRCNGKGDGILVAGTFELHDGIIEDNEVFLFAKNDRITVKGSSLSGSGRIEVTSNAWTNAGANHAVEFESSGARSALASRFFSGNDQWSLSADGKYQDAVMVSKDISYKGDFDGAETVTVTDFQALKTAVESTERGGKKVIKIGASFDLEDNITLPYNTSIRLVDDGTSRTLRRSSDFKGVLFSVGKASDLVIAGEKGLSIDGNSGRVTAKDPMIKMVWGGTFVLESGARLQNAFNSKYDTADRAGAVNAYGGRFIINGGTISDCGAKANDSKGTAQNLSAIYVATSSVISIKGGTITGCGNGAIRSYGRVYMSGGTISGNRRVGDGGAAVRAANMVMTGGTIKNNFSSNSGCGIYITPSEAYPTASFRMSGGTITGNTSSRDTDKGASAGAVYIAKKAVAHFESGTISNNVAGKGDGASAGANGKHGGMSGAGIYNEGTSYVEKGMKITGNTAYNSGGGIYSNGKLYINGATITGNKTVGVYKGYGGGGAIMLTGESYTEIKNATISDNKSGSSGTIYIDGSAELVMKDTVMKNNTATGESFSGYNSGSAILNKNKLTVSGSTFEGNKAGAKAAIYTDAGSRTVITGSKFVKNTAAGAAAIVNTSAYTEVRNTVFDGNSIQGTDSYSNGGAIMNQRKDDKSRNGEMLIDGCTFTGNTAHQRTQGGGGYGGAIYNDYGVMTVKNSKFSGNVAETAGKDILNSSNSAGLTLGGTLDAEELYFNVSKTVILADDFKAAKKIDTIFNTYESERKVLGGSDTVVAANSSAKDGTFVLKTTTGSAGEGAKVNYTVIDKDGYIITEAGILNGAVASVTIDEETHSYYTLEEAVAAANGHTITLLRNTSEDLTVPAGSMVSVEGPYKLSGQVNVNGTLNIKDTVIEGGAKVSGILGVDGAAQITGGSVDLGADGAVRINGELSRKQVATLSGEMTDGRQVLIGAVTADSVSKFDLEGDGSKQINSEGKVSDATEVARNKDTGVVYDTLAEAVAAAQEGETIELISKASAGEGIVVDKNLTITSADSRYVISGDLTVAAGKTLTLAGDISASNVILAGEGAKLGFDGELSQTNIGSLDVRALGSFEKLKSDKTVVLAGDMAKNYDKVTLTGAESTYMLTPEGTLTDYAEARIGSRYYTTLEEAVEAAKAGDKVELVNNVQLEATLVIRNGITLTTDGVKDHTITATKQSDNDFMINIKEAKSDIGGASADSRLILDGQNVEHSRPVLGIQTEGTKVRFLTIRNSRTSYTGGAVYGNITGISFEDCVFENNTGSTGGAVYMANETSTTFTNCTFTGNRSTATGNSGGAVNLPAAGTAVFNGCTFTGNSSAGYGGVFSGTGSSAGKASRFICTDCTFTDNTSENVGGVAYMSQSGQTYPAIFAAFGCTFSGNSSAGNGSVVRATGGFVIEGCTFTANEGGDAYLSVGNTAAYSPVTVNGKTYEARYVGGSTFDVTRGRGVSGTWKDNGDNTFVEYVTDEAVAKIGDTEFKTLEAAYEAAQDGDTIVIVNDVILEGQLITDKTLTIRTDGQTRTVTCPDRGSYMIYARTGVLRLEGTGEDGRLILDGTGSSATANRPILTFQSAGCSASYVTVQNSMSTDGGYGGGAYVNVKDVVFDNCKFINNTAKATSGNGGGALRVSASGDVTANNCQFTGNRSENYGGAVTAVGSYGKITLNGCTFSGNSSASVGGAIYGNQSSGNGSWVIADNCTFDGNTAGGNGAVIRSTGNIQFTGCTFAGNSGTDGDISVSDAATFTRKVSGSVFDKTKSNAYGSNVSTITLGASGTDDNTYAAAVVITIDAPTQKLTTGEFTGSAHDITAILDGFDSTKMSFTAEKDGESVDILQPGVYTITVKAGDAYNFTGDVTEVSFTYTVSEGSAEVAKPTLKPEYASYNYDGNVLTAADILDGFDAAKMTATITRDGIEATLSEAGTYTVTVKPAENFRFPDNAESVEFTVTVEAAIVAKIGETGYTSLPDALTAANEGDTIVLVADTGISDSLIINKAVTITTDGSDRTINLSDAMAEVTGWAIKLETAKITLAGTPEGRIILDGRNLERDRGVLWISSKAGATVSYVTVQNSINKGGAANNGAGGVHVSNGPAALGDTVIDHMIIQNCESKSGNGGGMTINTPNIQIRDSRFVNNKASGNGGGLNTPSNYAITVDGCVFENNTAAAGNSIYTNGANVAIRHCFFDGDTDTVRKGSSTVDGCTYLCDYMEGAHTLLDKLPAYTDGILVGYADGDESTEEVIYTATADAAAAYADQAAASLSAEAAKKTTEGITTWTIRSGGTRYILHFTARDGALRIIAEPAAYSNSTSYSHSGTGFAPTVSLINVSDDTDDTRYGLSLLYQIEDGSFIVVDGGYRDGLYADTNNTSATRLYNKMVELNGSESGIRIAAWLLTHPHNDHVAALTSFANRYKGSVTLEKLIYNMPADYEYSLPHGEDGANTDWRDNTKALSWAQNVIKAHTGDVFYIGGATVNVLYTAELLKPMNFANINETSVIYRISLGDYSTMVLGDTSQYTEPVLTGLYNSSIKADIVTTAHHGYTPRGVSSALYQAIAPEFVLWPASTEAYNANTSNAANKWLLANVSEGKIHIAKDYTAAEGWAYTMSLTQTETPKAAQVGETVYATIAEALSAVPEGGTVTLLHSASGAQVDKNVAITGNYAFEGTVAAGKTLTVSGKVGDLTLTLGEGALVGIASDTEATNLTVTNASELVGKTVLAGNTEKASLFTLTNDAYMLYEDGGLYDKGTAMTGGKVYATLADAYAAASAGSTITIIRDETMTAVQLAVTKAVTITSDKYATRTLYASDSSTIGDAGFLIRINAAGASISGYDASHRLVISGEKLTAARGRGLLYVTAANTTVAHIDVKDVASKGAGAGMYINQTGCTVEDCTFTNCDAQGGGGGGLLLSNNTSITIKGCTFTGNMSSTTGGYYGGAFGTSNSSSVVTLEDCTFTGNVCKGTVGGGALTAGSKLTIRGNVTVNDNSTTSASAIGGGIFIRTATGSIIIESGATLTLNGNTSNGAASAIAFKDNGAGTITNNGTLIIDGVTQ